MRIKFTTLCSGSEEEKIVIRGRPEDCTPFEALFLPLFELSSGPWLAGKTIAEEIPEEEEIYEDEISMGRV